MGLGGTLLESLHLLDTITDGNLEVTLGDIGGRADSVEHLLLHLSASRLGLEGKGLDGGVGLVTELGDLSVELVVHQPAGVLVHLGATLLNELGTLLTTGDSTTDGVVGSFLLASSRAAMDLRPRADLAALDLTTPVSLSILASAFLSFLRTTAPSLWIFLRKAALVLRTWSRASRRIRRVAAAMAAFFLACIACCFQRAPHTPAVDLRSLFSACLRSFASCLRTEERAWLNCIAMPH